MKKTILLLLASLVLVFIPGCSTLKTESALSTVAVTASATISIHPDEASFTVTSEALSPTTEEARNASSVMINGAISILKAEFGVSDSDIVTNQMSISPSYEWRDSGRVLVGQMARQSVTVTLTGDLSNAGLVYDRLSSLDGIFLSSISYGRKDRSEAESEARRKAVENARAKAEDYASGLGLKVGSVLSISDGSSVSTGYASPAMLKVANAEAAYDGYQSTTYYSTDISVRDSVSVLFSLEK